jgi:hypothetical protein
MKKLLSLFLICLPFLVNGQFSSGSFGRMGGGVMNGANAANKKGQDSFQKRDVNADSITIYYKLYNSNQLRKLDSSINDFFKHMPLSYDSYHLGNLGNAAHSYLYAPITTIGFDPGMHSFDAYRFDLDQTPLYQTTRPYTELGYLLGGKAEQLIELTHTQNRGQNMNFSFDFRFTNAPGSLKNQNANFSNIRFTSNYVSKRKRYTSNFIFISNKMSSSENGGLINAKKLDSLSLNDPFELDTRLGISGSTFRNPFNTSIATGNVYQDNGIIWRQSYALGQKDSIVKDTNTIYLFYPRVRFQNEIKFTQYQYTFQDANPDSAKYANYFNFFPTSYQSINYTDKWNVLVDEMSMISYPDKMNANQFLQLGVGYGMQNLNGSKSWSNQDIYGFGVYRNKTKNQQWDLDAEGKMYLTGFYAGDFNAKAAISKKLTAKGAFLQIGFSDINKTPSLMSLGYSNLPSQSLSNINKENIIQFWGNIENEPLGWKTKFSYQMISNLFYYSKGFTPMTNNSLIHYMQLQSSFKINISKHWKWYQDWNAQWMDGNSPIHVPSILTRQRIAFEGNFYKNLNLSTGLEAIYHTDFKADGYMPFNGQFYVQNDVLVSNKPTANLFLHFLIKRFKGYIRMENLNTLLPSSTGGTSYNFTAPNYPGAGLWFRAGIWWNFIN